MTAAHILRRLVRKLAKPFCLWLASAKKEAAERHAKRFRLEREMHEHAVKQAERCNAIARW